MKFLTGLVSLFCHHLSPLQGAPWKMRNVQVGSAVLRSPQMEGVRWVGAHETLQGR